MPDALCADDDDALGAVLEGRVASVCGSDWQDAYTALHATAAASPSPRILVFNALGNGGYADRLTGLMTALLLAILSDRALTVDWPGYEAALSTPRLASLPQLLRAAKAAPESEVRRVVWLNANRKTVARQVIEAAATSFDRLEASRAGLDRLWPERVVFLRSNRGFTQALLNRSSSSSALASSSSVAAAQGLAALADARGLSARNAQFGCLFNYLLKPHAHVLAPLRPLIAAMRDPAYVTVGVHVRTGDATWAAEEAAAQQAAAAGGGGGGGGGGVGSDAMRARGRELYASHRFIYDFADRLAAGLAANRSARASERGRTPLQTPIHSRLLLLGDSSALRAHVASTVLPAERVLLPTVGALAHVARRSDADALATAVGEHWAYAHAAAFVYSSHSGFPRTAACRALRDDAIYTCFHYGGALFNADQPTARECSGPYSVPFLGERHAAGL